MNIINTSGITRPFVKFGKAVVLTVQPAANLIEMATAHSTAWTVAHAANLQAKTERDNAVREESNKTALRKALATVQQATLDTNVFSREVEKAMAVDAFKDQIHEIQCKAIVNLDPSAVAQLAAKDNLTDTDILRAAKMGYTAPVQESSDKPNSGFDISRFKQANAA